jgi:hypothetical protein
MNRQLHREKASSQFAYFSIRHKEVRLLLLSLGRHMHAASSRSSLIFCSILLLLVMKLHFLLLLLLSFVPPFLLFPPSIAQSTFSSSSTPAALLACWLACLGVRARDGAANELNLQHDAVVRVLISWSTQRFFHTIMAFCFLQCKARSTSCI